MCYGHCCINRGRCKRGRGRAANTNVAGVWSRTAETVNSTLTHGHPPQSFVQGVPSYSFLFLMFELLFLVCEYHLSLIGQLCQYNRHVCYPPRAAPHHS